MSKKDRLNAVIRHLMAIGKVNKQRDIALALACTDTTLSQARKGVERSLTDNFLMRILVAYPDIFSTKWLMTGEGEMLLNNKDDSSSASLMSSEESDHYTIDENQSCPSSLSDIAHTYNISTDAHKAIIMSELLTAIVQLNNRVTSLEASAAYIAAELSESKKMLTTLYQLLTNPNIKQS